MQSRKRKRGKTATTSSRIEHPYVLTNDELKIAHARSKTIVMTTKDFSAEAVFFRTKNMKSHDWKEVCLHAHIVLYYN